jgi:glycosyltransferase involved in cell wall biosynthesis
MRHPHQDPVSPKTVSKRALFVVLTDYPGGAERVVFSAAAELASRADWAVEVMVACSAAEHSFTRQALPASIRVRYGPFRKPFLAVPLLSFRLLLRRYDFVCTTHIYTNALVSMMRRSVLVRIGRLAMRESMSLFDRFHGSKAKMFELLYRGYGGEDVLIAQTGYMADHVRGRVPAKSAAKLRVSPNPVDLSAIRRAKQDQLEPDLRERLSNKRNILFCGRFVDFKRPGLALEVFRLLKEHVDGVQLVFMGAGPLEPGVREEAARLGLAQDVLFLGQRTNPYPVMAACQYGLLTSANEGFPNVILEMMACGMKGIVLTPCAGDLDTLAGVLVTETDDAPELAEALRRTMRSGADLSALYRTTLESRSVPRFVDRLLAD